MSLSLHAPHRARHWPAAASHHTAASAKQPRPARVETARPTTGGTLHARYLPRYPSTTHRDHQHDRPDHVADHASNRTPPAHTNISTTRNPATQRARALAALTSQRARTAYGSPHLS